MKKHGAGYFSRILLALGCVLGSTFPIGGEAAAAVTVTPATWNIVGLDSNTPAFGPNRFPVGAKVCSTNATETVNFAWDDGLDPFSGNAYINLRPGSNTSVVVDTSGGCADAYFEAEVTKTSAAFDNVRRYRITTNSGASTPVPRELYVEHLVSQSRNGIDGVEFGPVSSPLATVAAGGSMNLMVGNTYTIKLHGHTAPGGYNQFEEFINFPNTIFQVLGVSTTYTSLSIPSPYVSSPNPALYADACLWDNDPFSPNYMSCVGGDQKAGDTVITTYTVKIISGGGSTQTLNTLLYDFSGSSFHYNADFSSGARFANIIDPTNLGISKNFYPSTTNVGGISTLTFTLSNPNAGAVSGANFTDDLLNGVTVLPLGGAMTVASPANATTSGCGTSAVLTAVAGGTSIAFSNGAIAANSSCTVQVNVTTNATGTYTNTSGNLFVDAADTGHNASAALTVNTAPPPPAPSSTCSVPLELARWTMPASGQGSGGPPPPYTSKAADVATATASYVTVSGAQSIANGNPANAWGATAPTGGGGWSETSTSMNNYFQFVLDTSKYGGVRASFDVGLFASGDWANPSSDVYVNTSANGGAFSVYQITPGVYPQASKNGGGWATGLYALAAATGTSTTTFRFGTTGSGSNKPNATMYLDNVVFTGCSTPDPNKLTLTKSFASNPVAVNGTSALTFTVTNNNTTATETLTGIAFTDILPSRDLQGTVAVANGSAAVTGAGTAFKTQLAAGSMVSIGGVSYTVSSIASDTALTLTANYAGATAGGLSVSAGLTVATGSSAQCGGTLTTTAPGTISFSGGTLAPNAGANASCTFSVTVKANAAGSYDNVTGFVSSTQSGTNTSATGIGKASLTAILPPRISKSFATNPILVNGVSRLTFTISNPNQDDDSQLTGVAFSDTFPTSPGNMVVATSPNTSTSCGGSVTAAAGAGSMSFSGGTVAPGGTCTVTVDVTAPTLSQLVTVQSIASNTQLTLSAPYAGGTAAGLAISKNSTTAITGTAAVTNGSATVTGTGTNFSTELSAGSLINIGTYRNVSGPVSAAVVGNGNSASDSLTVSPSYPDISLFKEVAASNTAATLWGYYLTVPVGAPVYYQFTVQNDGDAQLSSVSVTDPLVNMAACVWKDGDGTTLTPPFTLEVPTNANNKDFAVCVIGPITALSGSHLNTASAVGTYNAVNYTDTDYATYATTGLTLVKSATQTYFALAGDVLNYSYAVTNSGFATLAGPVTVADNKATVACPALTTVGNFDNYLQSGETVTCTATYTVTAADVTAKLVTNTASASTTAYGTISSVTSSPVSKTVPLAPDLTAAKTDSAGGTVLVGGTFTWTITVGNAAAAGDATFGDGQTLLTDDLPTAGATYSVPATATLAGGTTGTVNCAVAVNTLTCTAGGAVTVPAGGSFSVPVAVTATAAGALVNPKSGGECKANPAGAIPEIDAANNGCANTVAVLLPPSLALVKSVQPFSDPVNGTTNPRSIPGAVMEYTLLVTNGGEAAVDSDTMTVSDVIPANTVMCVANACGNPPVAFSCSSTPPCGLTYDYAANVTYSNQAGGGAPYGYAPAPDANGFDANVTGVRINPTGAFGGASGGNDSTFSLTFKVKLK